MPAIPSECRKRTGQSPIPCPWGYRASVKPLHFGYRRHRLSLPYATRFPCAREIRHLLLVPFPVHCFFRHSLFPKFLSHCFGCVRARGNPGNNSCHGSCSVYMCLSFSCVIG